MQVDGDAGAPFLCSEIPVVHSASHKGGISSDPAAWWRVDLSVPMYVRSVRITGRFSVFTSVADLEVRVSDRSSVQMASPCDQGVVLPVWPEQPMVSSTCGANGRYMFITLRDGKAAMEIGTTMALCEVEVFAHSLVPVP